MYAKIKWENTNILCIYNIYFHLFNNINGVSCVRVRARECVLNFKCSNVNCLHIGDSNSNAAASTIETVERYIIDFRSLAVCRIITNSQSRDNQHLVIHLCRFIFHALRVACRRRRCC